MTTLIEKPTPGMFKAVCRLGYWTPDLAALMLTETETPVSKWDKKTARNVFQGQCSVEFTGWAELDAHMREVHEGGRYRWDSGSIDPHIMEVRNYKPRTPSPVPMWKSPRLTEEGKPFEPTGLEIGARVEWDGRTGQVWSLGSAPKSVWVVPDEPSVQSKDGAGTRHELAALLVQLPGGRLSEHQTSWSSWKTEAA